MISSVRIRNLPQKQLTLMRCKKKWKLIPMFKKFFIAALLAATCSMAHAEHDPLTPAQMAGTGVIMATYLADYAQTRDIKNHPNLYETNIFMGKHPSDARVRNYFVTAALTTAAIVYILPSEYRKYFIGGVILVELNVINHNKRAGIRMRF